MSAKRDEFITILDENFAKNSKRGTDCIKSCMDLFTDGRFPKIRFDSQGRGESIHKLLRLIYEAYTSNTDILGAWSVERFVDQNIDEFPHFDDVFVEIKKWCEANQ
jgi:hypothetical protein